MIVPERSDSNQVDGKLDDQRSYESDKVQGNILSIIETFLSKYNDANVEIRTGTRSRTA